MDNTPPTPIQSKSAEQLAMQAADQHAHAAGAALHEDVLTHLTKSAVEGVSSGLHLGLSEHTCDSTATWIARAAKSVPLFMPAGGTMTAVTYGVAAALYGAGEAKWGDSADNIAKDAVLGGLKGVGIKGSMDLIGHKMQESGLANRFWSAPAQGVAFGVSSTAIETALSRSTYHDAQGNYRGIGYGLENTVKAVANPESLVIGAATFTLGAAAMKGIQASPIASAFPEVVGSRVFQNATTGFSFGAFSGMADEANRQAKSGGFSPWELNKFNYGEIAKQGLFQATSDATGAAIAGKYAAHVMPIEQVEHKNVPSEQTIRRASDITAMVDQPLRSSVNELWDKNIKTVRSGVYHDGDPQWSTFPSPVHIGEYEPVYYKQAAANIRTYIEQYKNTLYSPEDQADGRTKRAAYIVLDERNLSPENQRIAREFAKYRKDLQLEIQVPYTEGTPAREIEKRMQELVSRLEPQPLKWGYQTPIQFYRSETGRESGVPTQQWMSEAVSSPEFKARGLVWDSERNLVFESADLAKKYQAVPPVEPTWYYGPDVFGNLARGGWRQAYNQVAAHLYTLEGQGINRDSVLIGQPDRNFTIDDLMHQKNADHYFASKENFFELYGTPAYDFLADRHWLNIRKNAFEVLEREWPAATLEKDRGLMLGSVLLARATEGHGYFSADKPMDVFSIEAMMPKYLWRDPSGRQMSTEEVVYKVNKAYYDIFNIAKTPFDHTFGKAVVDQIHSADGDKVVDEVQFKDDSARSLDAVLRNGWKMRVSPQYIPLLKEILQKQGEGFIPDHFDSSKGANNLMEYKPVYRPATAEERIVPLSELVKNLKIVDYGFSNRDGKVLGKVSLASHDVHDHARAFWLLDSSGLFDGTAKHQGYKDFMGKMTDPVHTGIFKREGELVASIAYDWRNFFDTHPSYEPPVDLNGIRNLLLHADRQGIPLSNNQARALDFVEEQLRNDPNGQSPSSKRLRHIVGGVWMETLEQKRKTETTMYKRNDGTFQRLSATNPEYVAFVIDAARALENCGPQMWYALNLNNLKMESYLRDVAALPEGSKVPKFRYSPEEIKQPQTVVDDVPVETVQWLMQHPGFNTRRAPIRNWILGIPTAEEVAEQQARKDLDSYIADMRRRDYESQEWRNLLYRND